MEHINKLGFGFMRLPQINGSTDINQVNEMVDKFFEAGFSYFDTAYVYGDGISEQDINTCVTKRYPREKFQLADKLPIGSNIVQDVNNMQEIFNTSLNRTGVSYFDFYLLHALNKNSAKKAEDTKAWEFLFEMKKQGKIKHVGFSFHDTAEVLDDILTKHPEAEFVQLQLNYYDWENNDVQSRLCYEVALKHNKPIIIMEPVKGGTLANIVPKAEQILKKHSSSSVASWAIRYAVSLKNVVTVLSGMSNFEQLNDNVETVKNFKAITTEENEILNDVVKTINETPTIPCTDCKYCVSECPMEINIPEIFKSMNYHLKFDPNENVASNKWSYERASDAPASSCVSCAACEAQCPQKINIIDELVTIANLYEN